jgi:hypothetical protein
MIVITKNLANDIINIIKDKILNAQVVTDIQTRDVLITNKNVIDDTANNELLLNIELYRSEEVAETLTEIRFYDSANSLVLKSSNLNINLPATKVSFIYQIKLVYSP